MKTTKVLRVVIKLVAGFVFALEVTRPDPGLTGGTILTCLLVAWLIFIPLTEDDDKEDKGT